jgi:8-hydroxy-5-deazaflavin:NADPH oxidoreductase
MRIAVIGAGSVGTSLASGFAQAGHDVILGTRDAGAPHVESLSREYGDSLRVSDYRTAAQAADLVVLAVPGRVVVETVMQTGTEAFAGRIVIDATNPVLVTDEGVTSAFGEDDSAAEALQRALPDAHVVKAFNQIEAANMLQRLPDEKRPLRIAGDDDQSKAVVTGLLESFGWKVRDLGPLSRARPLERGVVDWVARQHSAGSS